MAQKYSLGSWVNSTFSIFSRFTPDFLLGKIPSGVKLVYYINPNLIPGPFPVLLRMHLLGQIPPNSPGFPMGFPWACQVATCKKWQSIVWPWRLILLPIFPRWEGQQKWSVDVGNIFLKKKNSDSLCKNVVSTYLWNMIPEPLPTGYRRIYFIVG